ncbi:unnamed protein product [Chrysodeixis includens]|uniref:Uncharacterized protein n=1 Tax=Chrysodeixis includens TaxID=689277 RepID=A0A9N8KXL0_CHRIL|nr:unnamed protein product [Chrysodeixis includens]
MGRLSETTEERSGAEPSFLLPFRNTEAVIFISKTHTTFEKLVFAVGIELETIDFGSPTALLLGYHSFKFFQRYFYRFVPNPRCASPTPTWLVFVHKLGTKSATRSSGSYVMYRTLDLFEESRWQNQRNKQEKEDFEKRGSQRKRYENIKNNAELWAVKQEKNRKSYIRRKEQKKQLPINEMPPREQRLQRKRWRTNFKTYYLKKKQVIHKMEAIRRMQQIPQWHCMRYRKFQLHGHCNRWLMMRRT